MSDLFEVPEMLSPRLAWMKKHKVKTEQTPKNMVDEEDEFGNTCAAWYAMFRVPGKTAVGGDTEQDAICNFAKYHRLKLWNEENL